jgi:hypothetical protein
MVTFDILSMRMTSLNSSPNINLGTPSEELHLFPDVA